jgi:hypothetical protein
VLASTQLGGGDEHGDVPRHSVRLDHAMVDGLALRDLDQNAPGRPARLSSLSARSSDGALRVKRR